MMIETTATMYLFKVGIAYGWKRPEDQENTYNRASAHVVSSTIEGAMEKALEFSRSVAEADVGPSYTESFKWYGRVFKAKRVARIDVL